MDSKTITIIFLGDVMLGRLIDQLCSAHVDEPEEAAIVRSFRDRASHLAHYAMGTPWGNTLPLLKASNATIINLETSVTTNSAKWPNKVFNYRMHPDNIEILKAANIAYVSLANNHTLDFGEKGLMETMRTLDNVGITYAGAGSTEETAMKPATIDLVGRKNQQYKVSIWAGSDHPSDWAQVKYFNFVTYSAKTRQRLKEMTNPALNSQDSTLRVFSIHWGPNYQWHPAPEIVSLAHFLIDDCEIDIVHGHSSHHVQGVELYQSKLIIYGCGDFIDDYALNPKYRNDLSAIWRVNMLENASGLKLDSLEVLPTRIQDFQARTLPESDPDSKWVCGKVMELSQNLGTTLERRPDGPGLLLRIS